MANQQRTPKISRMGNENSKSQATPAASHTSLQSTTTTGEYPFQQRNAAVRALLEHVTRAEDVTSPDYEAWWETCTFHLNTVKQVFLIKKCQNIDEQTSMLLDRTSCDLVALIEKYVDEQPAGWQPECETLCQVLCSHISAPTVPGKIPDSQVTNLVQLNLVNITIKSQQGLSGLMSLLQKNKKLEAIEFGFTGMKTDTFHQAFRHMTKLQSLTYLGLRGNRLDNTAVSSVQKSLQNSKTLPRLMWVDFANNTDIVSVPMTLLDLLKQRWPLDQYHPTFRELLDSKIVVHKSVFVLMI